jgi:hypothetical protein
MKAIYIKESTNWLRSDTEKVAKMLTHFQNYREVKGSGIKGGSCCAVVIDSGARREVYGNSQAVKLDLDAWNVLSEDQSHAEVVAFEVAKEISGKSPKEIFCELSPCPKCINKFNGKDVVIYYMFEYTEEGRAQWLAFHDMELDDQIQAFRKAAGLDK